MGSVMIFTAEEATNERGSGIAEPTLRILFQEAYLPFCHYLRNESLSEPTLDLSGGENKFVCIEESYNYQPDAELVLRNVGLSPTPEPEMDGAILEGYYTANGGAERYFIRLHSFFADEVVLCSNPGALL